MDWLVVWKNNSFERELAIAKVDYISKVGDRSQGRPEGSLFNSYYTKV